MAHLPKVSILIPARNAEKTLHIAIEDATQQEGVDWQIIIANDNSTDGTVQVIEDYQAHFENIAMIDIPAPGGIVAGRNALLQKVDTPFIAWLDADDGWPRKDKLRRQIDFLEKNKAYALVGDAKVKGVFLSNLKQKNFRFPLTNEDLQVRLIFKNAFIMSSIVARADLAKKVPFDPEMEYLEDYVWVQGMAKEHKVANMVLGGTLHFIGTPEQQKEKDDQYTVYNKEAHLLKVQFLNNGFRLEEEYALLADFVRRNRNLDATESNQLKGLIQNVSHQLINAGYKKSAVNGFFWDVNMRRLKCRWLL